jgi:hypothetical protein
VRLLFASRTPIQRHVKVKSKPTRTIQPMKPTSRNAKAIIWPERFGVLDHFVFSGFCSAASAPYAISRSPGSRNGVFTIASPV